MKVREKKRLEEKEIMEREGQDILKQIQKGQQEEMVFQQKRKADAFKNLEDIKVANEQSIALKQQKLIEEKEEEDKILQYNMDKA